MMKSARRNLIFSTLILVLFLGFSFSACASANGGSPPHAADEADDKVTLIVANDNTRDASVHMGTMASAIDPERELRVGYASSFMNREFDLTSDISSATDEVYFCVALHAIPGCFYVSQPVMVKPGSVIVVEVGHARSATSTSVFYSYERATRHLGDIH